MAIRINRRAALGGAAALAAFPAAAQGNKKIIVGTWGGDYSKLLTKNIDTPLLVPKGWEVIHAEENVDPRKAKMLAEKSLRRGTSDVQGLSANDMYEVNEQGLVEQLDYSKIPNSKNLIPAMKYAYGIGHIFSGKVVLYNPKLMEAPTGFADTLDPKHGNKLGIIDIQRPYNMIAAALASFGLNIHRREHLLHRAVPAEQLPAGQIGVLGDGPVQPDAGGYVVVRRKKGLYSGYKLHGNSFMTGKEARTGTCFSLLLTIFPS